MARFKVGDRIRYMRSNGGSCEITGIKGSFYILDGLEYSVYMVDDIFILDSSLNEVLYPKDEYSVELGDV